MENTREIAIVFTGGTIGMSPEAGTQGVVPGGNFEKIIHDLAGQTGDAHSLKLRTVQWTDIPSPHVTPADMLRLSQFLDGLLEEDGPDGSNGLNSVDGAVVLHGTDVLMESAFMCDVTMRSDKTVVFTGAMRYYAEAGYEGVRNLVNAIRACLLPLQPGTGVAIMMNDRLFSAREVNKINSMNVNAFDAGEAGLLGYVAGERVVSVRSGCGAKRVRVHPEQLAACVPLITCYTGMQGEMIEHACYQGMDGLVLEGFGAGNVPPGILDALDRLLERNIPVILTTRCLEGGVWPIYGYPGGGADLKKRGVILSGRLGGPKARLLLMAILGETRDLSVIRNYFKEILSG